MNLAQQIKHLQKTKLDELIVFFGSKYRLAKALGDSQQTVQGWHNRGRISAKAAIRVEALTDGKFKKEDLRPDVASWEK